MDTVLSLLAGAVLVLGLSSRLLKRNSLSPVLLALLFGTAVGPAALGWVDPTLTFPRGPLLEEVTRVALALSVADIGLKLTRQDLRSNAARLALLLTVGMAGMWLLTALGGWFLLGLPVVVALVLGATLTPTDPAVASALVSGVLPSRMLPSRLRTSLQGESAVNDGLALPFVLLAGLLATRPAGSAVTEWLGEAARGVGVAVVVGVALGWLAGRLLRFSEREELVAESYLPLVGVALALLTLGVAHLLGGSGILGAFVAALTVSLTLPETVREAQSTTLTAAARFAVVAVFGVFGTVLPWPGWAELGVLGVAFGVWVLLVRRPPVVWLALLPTDTGRTSRTFLAWFGPLGVAGIYYIAYVERYGLPEYERLFAAGSLAICVSVLVHTLTSTPGVTGYARRAGTERPEGESVQVRGPLP